MKRIVLTMCAILIIASMAFSQKSSVQLISNDFVWYPELYNAFSAKTSNNPLKVTLWIENNQPSLAAFKINAAGIDWTNVNAIHITYTSNTPFVIGLFESKEVWYERHIEAGENISESFYLSSFNYWVDGSSKIPANNVWNLSKIIEIGIAKYMRIPMATFEITSLILDIKESDADRIKLLETQISNLKSDTLRLFNANTGLVTANAKLITDTLRLFNTNTNLVTANVKSLDSIEVLLDSIDVLLSKLDLATPVTQILKSDNKYGIRFTQNIVSDKAEISVVLPNNERVVETKFVIYDMTGNVVFENSVTGSDVLWNLTNGAGRFVANGTYLVIAEVKGVNGKWFAYSAKLGVKR